MLDSLRRYGQSGGKTLALGTAALYLALLDHPEVQAGPYLDHLDLLGKDVADAARVHPHAAALALALCDQHGYAGDTASYDDMQNADLVRVIDRRRGLPVALAVLFIDAARRVGWAASGIGFPGHFLVRLEETGGIVVLDPFAGGQQLDEGGIRRLLQRTAGLDEPVLDPYLQAAADVDVLLRLLNNIKARAVAGRDLERAGEILDRMVLIAPLQDGIWLERGIVRAEEGRLSEVMRSFENAERLTTSPHTLAQIQQSRARYRRRLN